MKKGILTVLSIFLIATAVQATPYGHKSVKHLNKVNHKHGTYAAADLFWTGIDNSICSDSETPELLTQPFLQAPTKKTVNVVWFTEFEGAKHLLVYGKGLEQLQEQGNLTLDAIKEFVGNRNHIQVASADSFQMTRTREDAYSNQAGVTYEDVTYREIWRHEATAEGLKQSSSVPYLIISYSECGETVLSDLYTLSPKPKAGSSLKILLTSDHQSKPMSAANMQKVVETVGQVDAVFYAGDLVNVPDRASEWFDDAKGGAYFPGLQGTASRALEYDGATTTYTGGTIIQNAPLFPVIGNHEVMGRVYDARLSWQFASPVPVDITESLYKEVAETINPDGEDQIREDWIKNNSFNVDTYEEIFTLPEDSPGGEKYYAVTYGDVRLISLFATRIWRSTSTTYYSNSAFVEDMDNNEDPIAQGYGRHIFEPIKKGSEQYNWLAKELNSKEFRKAKYTVVMLHHPVHSLGGNIFPAFTDPVRIEETDDNGDITSIRYEYPIDDDYLIRDLEPLLEEAGVDLVFNGHDHLYNRFKGPTGIHYLETSNVGNTYGSFTTGRSARSGIPGEPWNADYYSAFEYDDPYGLEPITPTVNPLYDEIGVMPYVSSNTISVFSVLETETGTITSYAFDTEQPESEVFVLDRFELEK